MRWEIKNDQVSFRISTDQKDYLNSLVEDLEKAHSTKIDSAKSFFEILINEYSELKQSENSTSFSNDEKENEITLLQNQIIEKNKDIQDLRDGSVFLDEETLNAKEALIKELGYSEPMPDETFYKDLLEVITLETLTPEPVEIEKEVIKEIPIKLEPNQTIVSTTPEQHNHLELIARWRLSVGKDKELSTVETIIKRMVFNEGTLLNYHGYFATGLKDKNLKK